MAVRVRFMFLYKDNDMADSSTDQKPDPLEDEIDALIAEFGSARAAIRALLHDLSILANDMNASTSRGYTRSRIVEIRTFRSKKA